MALGALYLVICLLKSALDNYVVKRSEHPLLEEVAWSRLPFPSLPITKCLPLWAQSKHDTESSSTFNFWACTLLASLNSCWQFQRNTFRSVEAVAKKSLLGFQRHRSTYWLWKSLNVASVTTSISFLGGLELRIDGVLSGIPTEIKQYQRLNKTEKYRFAWLIC